MEKLYFGAAYDIENAPHDRLEKDAEMMVHAGINVVRVCGLAWNILEPRDGEFDFSRIDRFLLAMKQAGIGVVAEMTFGSVPAWMAKKYPCCVLSEKDSLQGKCTYKANVTDKNYLFCRERMVRALTEHVRTHPAVLGYSVCTDREKYGVEDAQARRLFAAHLKEKYEDIRSLNKAFGQCFTDWGEVCDGWCVHSDCFDFAYRRFCGALVSDFFVRTAALVRQYARADQFVICNAGEKELFSGGNALLQYTDAVGVRIYHPSQDLLTGAEIAFCGDLARCLKGGNYCVAETQAQGFPEETPYGGQLRLQAFSHLASGAGMVMYSSWHSAHTSAQSRRKGVLGYDFSENETYREAVTVGRSFRQLQARLARMKKNNSVALLYSDLSEDVSGIGYTQAVRRFYEALYEYNFECDVVSESSDLSQYKVVLAPVLYCAGETLIKKLRDFVAGGGTLISSFRSFFADENGKVYADAQPHGMTDVFGMTYDCTALAKEVSLSGSQGICACAEGYMECLRLHGGAQILGYVHENWGQYAAATVNFYGKGKAYYFGCLFERSVLSELLQAILREEGVFPSAEEKFPVIVRSGMGRLGKKLLYVFNYSPFARTVTLPAGKYTDLLSNRQGTGTFGLEKWGVAILEKD